MGFLKRFFRNVFREGSVPVGTSSFERLSEEQLEAHLGVARYGDFPPDRRGPPVVRPASRAAPGLSATTSITTKNQDSVPVLDGGRLQRTTVRGLHGPFGSARARSRRGPGNEPSARGRGHADLYREHIDMPVLKSILYDYEDMLVNDGCIGHRGAQSGHSAGSAVRRAQAADRLRQQPGAFEASSPIGAFPATTR